MYMFFGLPGVIYPVVALIVTISASYRTDLGSSVPHIQRSEWAISQLAFRPLSQLIK